MAFGKILESRPLHLFFKSTTVHSNKTGVTFSINNLGKKIRQGMNCGNMLRVEVIFYADSVQLAESFIQAANTIKQWRYLNIETSNGAAVQTREFLVPPCVLPSLKAQDDTPIYQLYCVGKEPRTYCGGHQNFGISVMPNLPRLIVDYIGAAAQVTNHDISFPGPMQKEVDIRLSTSTDWNVLRDNHKRWIIPRELSIIKSDSPFYGIFENQTEWEAFLETLVGKVLTNYDCIAEMAKLRRTTGSASEHHQDENDNSGPTTPKVGFIYDGPSKGMTLVKLGKRFVYVFEVGLIGNSSCYVLDLNQYGRSMRAFRSFDDALHHAEGKGPDAVFRVDHDEHRKRRFIERVKQHFNATLKWD